MPRPLLAAALALPVLGLAGWGEAGSGFAGQDCTGITQRFAICPPDSGWAKGAWEHIGDGAAPHPEPLSFDSTKDWAGRHLGEHPTVAAALDALLADTDPGDKHLLHHRDTFDTGALHVARAIETITFHDWPPTLRATMIAEGSAARVMLMLNAPPDLPLAEMERRSREVAGPVRPADQHPTGREG